MSYENGKCPRCENKTYTLTSRKRLRCCACGHEYSSSWGKTCLKDAEWVKVVEFFLAGDTSAEICRKTQLSKHRVLEALTEIRQKMYGLLLYRSIDEDNFRYYLEGMSFWRVALNDEDPKTCGPRNDVVYIAADQYDIDNYLVNKLEDTKRSFFVLSNDHRIKLDRFHYDEEEDDFIFVDYVSVEKIGNRRLDILYGTWNKILTDYETDKERYSVLVGCDERLIGLIRKYILERKGINADNLHLYCAEVLWKHLHRAYSKENKVAKIKDMMLA